MASDSVMLLLVLGPGFALAVAIAYLTRNDPITAKATEQIQRQPIIRVENILASILGPIAIWFLANNMFGAIVLVTSGVFFLLQEKHFPNVYFIRGVFAKIFGVLHLGVGALIFALHIL